MQNRRMLKSVGRWVRCPHFLSEMKNKFQIVGLAYSTWTWETRKDRTRTQKERRKKRENGMNPATESGKTHIFRETNGIQCNTELNLPGWL
jgi:hypothetical protein